MDNISSIPDDGIDEILSEIFLDDAITWEIGPDPINDEITVLALGCHGDLILLDIMEKDLNLPMDGQGWKIVAGIPPKSWEGYFEMIGSDGLVLQIEGWDWQWSIAELNKDKASITIFYPEEYKIGAADIENAGEIILFGSIGEVNTSRHISVDHYLPISEGVNHNSMSTLREEFSKWFPDAPFSQDFKNIK
ncbi:hypothetical protein [Sphingomonas alpina]|uniref:Uncharacterized protein n=1 Tax=Sphingomonas alpina TaxID=653931 RepID=A0A7H0LF16_9SPHN|nr:hypothetical protein [Sphingomonas alpina]QNQ08269.1 hypothetical protein H3Z74_16100 [Sphingomonas alpina]